MQCGFDRQFEFLLDLVSERRPFPIPWLTSRVALCDVGDVRLPCHFAYLRVIPRSTCGSCVIEHGGNALGDENLLDIVVAAAARKTMLQLPRLTRSSCGVCCNVYAGLPTMPRRRSVPRSGRPAAMLRSCPTTSTAVTAATPGTPRRRQP